MYPGARRRTECDDCPTRVVDQMGSVDRAADYGAEVPTGCPRCPGTAGEDTIPPAARGLIAVLRPEREETPTQKGPGGCFVGTAR